MIENINLNLIPSGVSPVCHVSQYDTGRQIKINLFEGINPYTIQSGDTFTLNVRKPDNTIITTSSSAIISFTQGNNYIVIATNQQIAAVVGNNLCEIKITNGTKVIGTLNFIMIVERDVLSDGVASESVIDDLDAQVTTLAEEAVEPFISKLNQLTNDFYGSEEAIYKTGGYINTGTVAEGTPVSFTPVSNNNYVYCIMPCKAGEGILVSGASGNAPRLWAFLRSDKTIISVDIANRTRLNEVIIAPANTAYLVLNSQASATYGATKYSLSILDGDLIKIGNGTAIPSLSKGFDIARATGKGVIITEGVYNLNAYGFTIGTTGLIAPKKIYGYGVTLTLTFPQYSAANPLCSALNLDKIPECEIYGLTIHCKNARYCIHDELYNYESYYHHLFKDLTLIHECDTGSSGLWIAPRAIGGGIGAKGGLIEIVNCLTYSVAYEDINYHSKSDAAQTGEALVIVKDCALRKNASVSNGGTDTSFMNTMIVSNCISGKEVADGSIYNFKKVSWNNKILSGTSEFDSLFNLLGE